MNLNAFISYLLFLGVHSPLSATFVGADCQAQISPVKPLIYWLRKPRNSPVVSSHTIETDMYSADIGHDHYMYIE